MEISEYERNNEIKQLNEAVKRRDVRWVMHLLRDHRDISKSQLNELKLMHMLFHEIQNNPEQQTSIIEILKLLLDHGADVNVQNNVGHTVLHVAIKNRTTQVIDFLISRNAKLDVRDAYGDSIIHFLVRQECDRLYNHFGVFLTLELEKESLDYTSWMIMKGLDVDCKNADGDTALHYTLKNYRRNFTKLLLEYSKDVDVLDANGNTALDIMLENYETERFTFKKEAKETIRVLLEKGADIYKVNEDGYSPLINVVEKRKLGLLRLFKELGADFRRCYRKGNLLHYFFKSLTETTFQRYKAILDLLLDEGCDVNAKDDKGMTPLHFAARRVDPEIAIKLIERGADVNSREPVSGYTPLHEAVEYRNESLVPMLILKGADVNAKTDSGRSALHLINSNLKDTSVETVYYRPREWRFRGPDVQNFLEMFRESGRELDRMKVAGKYIIPVLIEHGVHIDVRDNDGILPLQAAILRRDVKMVKELVRYGADINDNVHVLSVNDYRLIAKVISEHLMKLRVAKLPIDDKLKCLLTSNRNFAEIHEDCLVEVNKLKSYNITESTSLHSFLQMDRNSKCAYIRNKKLQELIRSSELQKILPMYHVLISSAYYMAVERQKMLEPAKQIWLEFTNIRLPDLCIYEILNHLNNMHLRIMIEESS